MMMKLLVLLVALVSVASAYQRAFYGGDFKQAEGIYSPGFAVFDDNSKGWRRVPPVGLDPLDTSARVYDHYPVGENGIFVVGQFSSINNGVPSFGVAFFDGNKWCAIRQGLSTSVETNNIDGAGIGKAVWCDSETSCWVAGDFSSIENTPENAPNNAENFVHYVRESASSEEWLYDSSVTEWNDDDAPAPPAPNDAIPGTLVGVPSTNPEYFFFADGSADSYGTSGGFSSLYRGGKGDGGWHEFLSTAGVFSGANLRGFDIDTESSSPGVYVVSASGSTSEYAKKTSVLLRPCPPVGCSGPVTNSDEWTTLIPSSDRVNELFDVAVVNSTTRYYAGSYSPGGSFDTRNIVLVQDGFTSPVPVGSPFAQSSIDIYRVAVYEEKPVAIGNFETANLHFPTNTEDGTGVAEADIRELDSVFYIAIYEDGAWGAHFGGGLSPASSADDLVLALIVRHNPQSNRWSFTSPEITYVHNVKAEGLAYFDDASDLNSKNLYALFTHRISKRDGSDTVAASVYDVACETDACEWVYAGGDFGYHGSDLLGAIAKVEVRRENPVILAVGGGLWFTDDNVVPTDQNLQFTPGTVYAVKSQGAWVYAGGQFNRGKTGYVCLNRLARIRHSEAESGSWEPLAGGCDNSVYDLHFWGDDLYVAGEFENCGGTLVNYVTAYNNGAYRSLNNGLDSIAYSLEYFQERIIVGGAFAFAGGLPVDGVASWDGAKWRALVPACTSDCISGDLTSYFTVPVAINKATDLRASKDGTVLYARATVVDGSSDPVLAQWKYFDQGESGQWTIKGDHLAFASGNLVDYGDAIINNGTQLVVAGLPSGTAFENSGVSIHAYSLVQENWVDNEVLIGQNVYVVRSSASTLSSFLSFLF